VGPTPLPCFLEVLILKDFKSFEPEVLILMDFKSLFPEVLILVGLKSWRINEMQEIENFLEVLIPEELQGGVAEVLILRELRAINSNESRAFMNQHSRCVRHCQ
jgi:hypothetical protein